MPLQYSGVIKEHLAVRQAAGIFDASHMGELLWEGPGATAALNQVVVSDLNAVPVGSAKYTLACKADGGILDDLIVYHLHADQWLIVCNASNREKVWRHFESHWRAMDATALRSHLEDRSEAYALIAVQGPRTFDILHACQSSEAIRGLKKFRIATGTLAGWPCLAARTGYTGEDGIEIFCAPEYAESLFRALVRAGQDFGALPCGLGARDTLRLEAALSLYGQEITEDTHPFEAGLGWVVSRNKDGFIGADALTTIASKRSERRLVGLKMLGRGTARTGDTVNLEDAEVGKVTSGSYAPSLGQHIALAYVPREHARPGAVFKINLQQRNKTIEAEVVRTPFYKRPN